MPTINTSPTRLWKLSRITVIQEVMKSSSRIGFGTLHTKSRFINSSRSSKRDQENRMMRDKIVFTVTGKLQELLLRVDGLTLEKAVKVCRAYEQSTKQVKDFKENWNPSNPATKVNKVAQKPSPRVSRNKKSEAGSRHAKKEEGMKVSSNFCGHSCMGENMWQV